MVEWHRTGRNIRHSILHFGKFFENPQLICVYVSDPGDQYFLLYRVLLSEQEIGQHSERQFD